MLKIAIDLCYCSPERLYLWKEQYKVLLEYTKALELKEEQLGSYIHEVVNRSIREPEDNVNTLDYYEVVKSIHQDESFIQLIRTCYKLLDVLETLPQEILEKEYYAYLVFPEILKNIGFTQEEIDKIEQGENVYRFTNKSTLTETKKIEIKPPAPVKTYLVSKEQMAIFKKNWTLPQFRKEFGIENRVESKKNHTWNEDYKVCIFIKNSDGSEFEVGLSNSLGEPSIEEIQRREKELMVGLSDYGNYKLYDNKIPVLEKIDLGI